MKKLILTFTTLVLLSSSALAFQFANEPPDSPPSLFTKMAAMNSFDKFDDPSTNTGNDHEAHIEVDSELEENSKPRVLRKALQKRLPK
jgi:hypothetical protein